MLTILAVVVIVGILAGASPAKGFAQRDGERLMLSGDMAYFFGPGKPLNCTLNNRFKRGDPVAVAS
jgi:hypothetical protein